MERLRSPVLAINLTIELAELEWENTSAEFYGELLTATYGRVESSLLNIPINGNSPDVPLSSDPSTQAVRRLEIPGTGVLHMAGTRFRIAPGLLMDRRTLDPNQRLKKPK